MSESGQSYWRWLLAAGAIYGAESWLFLDHGAPLSQRVLGWHADPMLIIWCLAWWPWAITHHVHSLQTFLIWQPEGVNLAWVTSVPLLAGLALPVTISAGPVVAFNLLTLAAPVLAALACFLLCLELFSEPGAALIGGWLFGFSAYETTQSLDHLNLDFTALIPLILLVAVKRARGRMRRPAAVIALAFLLAGEFFISAEIFATLTVFGCIAWVLAYALAPAQASALRRLAVDGAWAAPLTLLCCAPLLTAMFSSSFNLSHPVSWPILFSTDLLNFVLPTQGIAIGGNWAAAVTQGFSGGLDEQTGYLGLPVFILLALAWKSFRHNPVYLLAYIMLGIVLIASLGPVLQIAGHVTGMVLPWALLLHVPLLRAALPARCMLYATLIIALVISGWVAAAPRRRWLAGIIVCVSLLPSPHPSQAVPDAVFFKPGRVQAVLGANPRLLVLPFTASGPSTFWQVENQFGYSQVGGYLGYPPAALLRYTVARDLYLNKLATDFPASFPVLCHETGAQFVIAGPGTAPREMAALGGLGWPTKKIDDVLIYTVPR